MKSTSIVGALTISAFLLGARAQAAESKPNYAVGEKAPDFVAKTTDGKTVKLSEAYKGKVVMLDFWATWCGPCRAEMPNVISAYEKFHRQGFEILGISLDRENQGDKLAAYTRDNKMPWPQVYDGKFWNAAIAQQYGIHSSPRPLLVDGDTGIILAEGPAARGQKLAPLIETALASKKKK